MRLLAMRSTSLFRLKKGYYQYNASIPQTSKRCSWNVSFTRLGAKEELHLLVWLLMSCALKTIIQQLQQNQASNKAKKLLSPMTKGQYSSDYHKISNWILGKYMCFLFFFFFLNLKELRLSWQSDLVRVDLMASWSYESWSGGRESWSCDTESSQWWINCMR